MTGDLLLGLARHPGVRRLIAGHPGVSELASRYVAGNRVGAALDVTRTYNGYGLLGLVGLVGSEDPDAAQIARYTADYLDLIRRLAGPLASDNEIAVTPMLLGLGGGLAAARPRLFEVVTAAHQAGVGVTIDMGRIDRVDATLQLHRELRSVMPDVGISVQANLHRTLGDCRVLASEGARVRLCAGAYPAPGAASHRRGQEADLAFVRCLRTLMESSAYPMVATHDRRLIPIAEELAERTGRTTSEYEFQMLYGVRPIEQRRLADTKRRCRVYLPFGEDWYDYVSRRLVLHPVRSARILWSKR